MYFLSNILRNSINELPRYQGDVFRLNVHLKAITTMYNFCLRSLFLVNAAADFDLPKIKLT